MWPHLSRQLSRHAYWKLLIGLAVLQNKHICLGCSGAGPLSWLAAWQLSRQAKQIVAWHRAKAEVR